VTRRKTEKERQLADGSGRGGWGRSQVTRENLVLYNNSILSGLKHHYCRSEVFKGPRKAPFSRVKEMANKLRPGLELIRLTRQTVPRVSRSIIGSCPEERYWLLA
jgi:hypothetical protein